ncbi:MAG TPA: GTPase Era [Kofleriaceae bacterium]|nr:GTPase Era [Kofleriaceae bacterium]
MAAARTRAGICAILGLPNAGKSTLMNQVLGLRLMAVSPKPQTTRNRVLGVKNREVDGDAAQIVFLDTPGAQRGPGALRQYMREQTLAAAGDCDVALLLLDAADPVQRAPGTLGEGPAAALDELTGSRRAPIVLALNKIDRVAKPALLPALEAWGATGRFQELVPISALKGDGLDRLEAAVARLLPEGPHLYPEDTVTDRAERFIAAELVREQVFRQLGDELPYAAAVVVEEFRERPDRGDVVISAVVHVERESQKGIVVGKGGQRIKAIGTAGRAAIAQLLGCPVHLLLHVKVSPNWSSGAGGLRDMGYE